MQTGTKISGAVHGAVVLAAIFGGPFFRGDRTEAIQVTEVSVITHSEFLALSTPALQSLETREPVDEPVLSAIEPQETEPEIISMPPELAAPEELPAIPASEPEVPLVATAEIQVEENPEPDKTIETVAETETGPAEPVLIPEPEVQLLEPETVAVSQPDPLDPPAQPSVVLPRPKPALEQVQDPAEEETVVAALLEELEQGQVRTPQVVPDTAVQPPASTPQRLTREESEGLKFAIRECWSVPIGIRNDSELKVTLGVELDRDGSVMGSPSLIEPSSIETSEIRQAFNAARRAVMRCQPYDLPVDKYEHWRSMEVVFNPEKMVLR